MNARGYVASSWRNEYQQDVVQALRCVGNGVQIYDFKNPAEGDFGFGWSQIDPNWKQWGFDAFDKAMKHRIAQAGFKSDETALKNCDFCLLVLPCGRSAHLELGWAAGNGKKTGVLFPGAWSEKIDKRNGGPPVKHDIEPELMYGLCDFRTDDLSSAVDWAFSIAKTIDRPYPSRR